MIGSTNTYASKIATEKIHITIDSNQTNKSDINTASVSVYHGNELQQTYYYTEREIIIDVLPGISYTLVFNEVANYKTPSSVTGIGTPGKHTFVTATYQTEIVNISLSASNGASVKGQTITVLGTNYTWGNTALILKVPYGQSYTVSANNKSGYTTPASVTMTASQPSRDISLLYEEIPYTISWSGSWASSTSSSAIDGKLWTSNTISHSGSTVQRCTFSGITSITFNCVYNGESSYDYLTIGSLDSSCTRSSYRTSLQGTSGTAKDITFSCSTSQHYVEFCYSKDGSVSTSPDCAKVYIKSASTSSGAVQPSMI